MANLFYVRIGLEIGFCGNGLGWRDGRHTVGDNLSSALDNRIRLRFGVSLGLRFSGSGRGFFRFLSVLGGFLRSIGGLLLFVDREESELAILHALQVADSQVSRILVNNREAGTERVTFAPQNSLRRIAIMPSDLDDIRVFTSFSLTTEELPHYQVRYLGAQHVDEFDQPTAVVDDEGNYGNAHLIWRRPDGLLLGASEPRRDGIALGL